MDLVRADDCKTLMSAFLDRLLRDAVGDAAPEEVQEARIFITSGVLIAENQESAFSFEQMCDFLDLPHDMLQPVFQDLELIGWRKNSIIYKVLSHTLKPKIGENNARPRQKS